MTDSQCLASRDCQKWLQKDEKGLVSIPHVHQMHTFINWFKVKKKKKNLIGISPNARFVWCGLISRKKKIGHNSVSWFTSEWAGVEPTLQTLLTFATTHTSKYRIFQFQTNGKLWRPRTMKPTSFGFKIGICKPVVLPFFYTVNGDP